MKNQIFRNKITLQYPSVTTYVWHTALLPIIEAYPQTSDWLYSNYIRFTGGIADNNTLILDFLPNVIDYVICPWIRPQFFSRTYIADHYTDIRDFFIESIDAGYCIFSIVNEEHVLRKIYGQEQQRFCHELLIFGYDLEKGKLNVADFTFTGKYEFREVDMEDVCQGYRDVTLEEDYIAHKREGVFLLQFNANASYKFDPWLVRSALEEYYTGQGFEYTTHIIMANNSQIDGSGRMGVEAYKLLYQHIQALADTDSGFDIRNPHAIYDHKVLMVARAKYMIEKGYANISTDIISELETIRDNAMKLRNLYLKLSINKSKDIINRLLSGYNEIESKEREIYPLIAQGLVM
jgi:hypothetical protein